MKRVLTLPRSERYIKRFETNKKVKSFLDRVDRWIKTTGGIDIQLPKNKFAMFGFKVSDVYEYLSLLGIFFGVSIFIILIFSRVSLIIGIVTAASFMSLPLALLYARVTEFKKEFTKSFLDTLETMLQGFKCGLTVEEVLEYVAQTQDNIVTPFLREITLRLAAGQSLLEATEEVSKKAFVDEFKRMCKILTLRAVTTTHITEAIEMLLSNIYDTLKSQIETLADKLQVRFVLIMLIGYVVPFLIMVIYPLVVMLTKSNMFGG